METKKIVCPKCGLNMEYWTRNNFINCTKCGGIVEVEACEDKAEEITLDDLLSKGIVFVDEKWNEETGEYWWEYYEDDDCTKAIEDIDEFVKNYNRGKRNA